jgi:hypothetical protein
MHDPSQQAPPVIARKKEAIMSTVTVRSTGFEIRFQSLFQVGRAVTFPCDAQGHVDLDAMSERVRLSYLHARALVGREYAAPAVMPSDLH